MYLKALEIQGFKSFAEKTRLTFEKDITAIVGPNGSGKSNISDAILWVMGEQRSKALRGSKMEDVIFGGTEKRGALGYAQVSLILDNSALASLKSCNASSARTLSTPSKLSTQLLLQASQPCTCAICEYLNANPQA